MNTPTTVLNDSPPVRPNAPSPLEQRFGPVEYRALTAITAYADNPRKHPEKQLVQLAASISTFGFVMPILVDVGGVVIAGHARLAAAQRLDMREVPVLVAEHWSKAQIKAYRLADNQLATAAKWDNALLRIELTDIIEIGEVEIEVLGWTTGEIDCILEFDSTAEAADPADEMPEPPLVPVARAGDIWLLGKHRLLCGSSLDADCWDQLMAGETAAMSLSDPPFNVRVNGHVWVPADMPSSRWRPARCRWSSLSRSTPTG